MLVFAEGGKPLTPMKNPRSKTRTNNKLNSHVTPGRNRTQATLVRAERSYHCANPAFQNKNLPCGIVGNEVVAGFDGLTTKINKSDPEIQNNISLFA